MKHIVASKRVFFNAEEEKTGLFRGGQDRVSGVGYEKISLRELKRRIQRIRRIRRTRKTGAAPE